MGRPMTKKVGDKFHMLTLVEDLGYIDGDRKFLARCDCGTVKPYFSANIGATRSCGCIKRARARKFGLDDAG